MKTGFLGPREKFLILEISPTGTNGLFMSTDEDRNLIFEKTISGVQLAKFLKSPARSVSQSSWEGKQLFKSRRKVIAVADPLLATTIPVPLDLRRETTEKSTSITLVEFENLIAQAMAKIFNQCRSESSRRLAIEELDTILVGAQIRSVKIDGKAVEDPVGHTGSKISLLLELTFTGRRTFEDLKQLFSAPDEFFFREAPQARLMALSRIRPLPLNLIVAEKRGTSLFIFESTPSGHPVLYRERLDWDFKAFIQTIGTALNITDKAAEELYEKYLQGTMSETVARHFRKLTEPIVQKLLTGLSTAKIKGHIYADTPHPLPFALPHREGTITFEEIPVREVADNLGFTYTWNIPAHITSRFLSPFFEAYFDKHYAEINKKLRRRLHWLAE